MPCLSCGVAITNADIDDVAPRRKVAPAPAPTKTPITVTASGGASGAVGAAAGAPAPTRLPLPAKARLRGHSTRGTATATKRLLRELQAIQRSTDTASSKREVGFYVIPVEDSLYEWEVRVTGGWREPGRLARQQHAFFSPRTLSCPRPCRCAWEALLETTPKRQRWQQTSPGPQRYHHKPIDASRSPVFNAASCALCPTTSSQRAIVMRVYFPGTYPDAPPFIRVIRPRFEFRTGHITIGTLAQRRGCLFPMCHAMCMIQPLVGVTWVRLQAAACASRR